MRHASDIIMQHACIMRHAARCYTTRIARAADRGREGAGAADDAAMMVDWQSPGTAGLLAELLDADQGDAIMTLRAALTEKVCARTLLTSSHCSATHLHLGHTGSHRTARTHPTACGAMQPSPTACTSRRCASCIKCGVPMHHAVGCVTPSGGSS